MANILKQDVRFPERKVRETPLNGFDPFDLTSCSIQQKVPLAAKLFVRALLQKRAEDRLGANLQYGKIFKHGWFTDTQWEAVDRREVAPPWVPRSN